MPPSIPTHRPLLTTTRSAILVAIVSALCSVFLVVESAYSRAATTTFAVSDLDCGDLAAAPAPPARLAAAAERASPQR